MTSFQKKIKNSLGNRTFEENEKFAFHLGFAFGGLFPNL